MANNVSHWGSRGKQPKMAGLYEVDADTTLAGKVDALIRKLDLLASNDQGISLNSKAVLFCETCG